MKQLTRLTYTMCSFLFTEAALAQTSFTIDHVCRSEGRRVENPSATVQWRIVTVDYTLTHLDSGKETWMLQEVALMGHAPQLLSLLRERFSTDTDARESVAWVVSLSGEWRAVLQADRLVVCGRRGERPFTIVLLQQRGALAWCQLDPYGGFEDRDHKFATYSPDLIANMRCYRTKD